MQNEPWVSLEDIAEHLGVSRDTIYRWIDMSNVDRQQTILSILQGLNDLDDGAIRIDHEPERNPETGRRFFGLDS